MEWSLKAEQRHIREAEQTLEVWCGNAAHNVGVHCGAVEEAHVPGQLLLQQWAMLPGVHNLKVTLHQRNAQLGLQALLLYRLATTKGLWGIS